MIDDDIVWQTEYARLSDQYDKIAMRADKNKDMLKEISDLILEHEAKPDPNIKDIVEKAEQIKQYLNRDDS